MCQVDEKYVYEIFHTSKELMLVKNGRNIRINGGGINYQTNVLPNTVYELVKIDSTTYYLKIKLNLVIGKSSISQIFNNILAECYTTYFNLCKYNLSNKCKYDKAIKYSDIENIIEPKTYYYTEHTVITNNDKIIVIHNNQQVELIEKPKSTKILKENKSRGVIIKDETDKWIEGLDKTLKYKKKLIITDNYYDSKNINNIIFNKFGTNQSIEMKDIEILLIDMDADKINKVLKIKDYIKQIKYKFIIIRTKNELSSFEVESLLELLFDSIPSILYDKTFTLIKCLYICYDMEKIQTTRNNKPTIIRKTYNITDREKYIIECLKPKTTKEYNIIDEIGISLYNIKYINTQGNMDCPICAESIDINNMCKTVCGHYFCIACISKLAMSNENNKDTNHHINCALCRKKNFLTKLQSTNHNKYSKITDIINYIDSIDKNFFGNILIYFNNDKMCQFLSKFCDYKRMNLNILTGTKKNKLNKIEKLNNNTENNVIIIGSKDYELSKYIQRIKKVIVTDNNYNYILNKESFGYDYNNNGDMFELIIFEYAI